MNEFLEQFLVEARELIEQATADLLALERDPSDRASLDGSFRAFHTLKGGAGIVDFTAMGRAMHAAEDVLSMVRQGDRPVTASLIGDCLACLDQVVQWLEFDRGERRASERGRRRGGSNSRPALRLERRPTRPRRWKRRSRRRPS